MISLLRISMGLVVFFFLVKSLKRKLCQKVTKKTIFDPGGFFLELKEMSGTRLLDWFSF